jgi:hypothetical protein
MTRKNHDVFCLNVTGARLHLIAWRARVDRTPQAEQLADLSQ